GTGARPTRSYICPRQNIRASFLNAGALRTDVALLRCHNRPCSRPVPLSCNLVHVDGAVATCEHRMRKKGGDVEWAMPVGIQRPMEAHFSLSECIQLR